MRRRRVRLPAAAASEFAGFRFPPLLIDADRAAAYPRVLDEQLPAAHHVIAQYANNPIETDHGRLKARLRPMRGLKRHRSAQIVGSGHALIQNIRRGHYEFGSDAEPRRRLAAAFSELAVSTAPLGAHHQGVSESGIGLPVGRHVTSLNGSRC